MGLLWKLAINVVDPLGLWRYLFLQPALIAAGLLGLRQPAAATNGSTTDEQSTGVAIATGGGKITSKSSRAKNGGGGNERTARELAYRATLLAMGAAALIWAAVFMYLTFYYTYMPAVEHVHPVRMQFDACNNDPSAAITGAPAAGPAAPASAATYCEFPHAFVRLDGAGQSRMRMGQSYKVYLHIDMPDSPVNRDLGMFMVCASMRDDHAELLDHACRAAMMHYRSSLVRAIRTWLLSPLYVFALRAEQQRVEVELFESYGLDQRGPVRDVYVELQSRHIQFYNVTLHVVAHFSGLRYAMWRWPLLSACVGIATNLLFILVALALSYYNWGHVLWFEQRVRQRLWLPGRSRLGKKKALTAAAADDDEKERALLDGDVLPQRQQSKVEVVTADGEEDDEEEHEEEQNDELEKEKKLLGTEMTAVVHSDEVVSGSQLRQRSTAKSGAE